MINWKIPINIFSGRLPSMPNISGGVNPFAGKLLPMLPNYYYNLPTFNLKAPLFSFKAPSFNFFPTLSYKTNAYAGLNSFGDSSGIRLGSGLGNNIVANARRFLGYNERDNSYKLFTNGRTEAWCADFVSYVVKDTCKKTGRALPSNFGSASVSGLKNWGKRNNCYLATSNSANKAQKIKNNVKPGDVIILKNSHTGIVKEVTPSGKIITIEGNTSDKVAERSYSINSNNIDGFIQLA